MLALDSRLQARTIESSATDGKWEATTSANPIRYAHLYHGEQYDGRVGTSTSVTPGEWIAATASTFNTGEGPGSVTADKALGLPVLLTMPPLEVSRRYAPVSVNRVGASKTAPQQGGVAATAAAPPLSFVHCVDAKTPLCGAPIWFEDAANKTRHHVNSCDMCGNFDIVLLFYYFDIILDRFTRISQLCTAPPALCDTLSRLSMHSWWWLVLAVRCRGRIGGADPDMQHHRCSTCCALLSLHSMWTAAAGSVNTVHASHLTLAVPRVLNHNVTDQPTDRPTNQRLHPCRAPS